MKETNFGRLVVSSERKKLDQIMKMLETSGVFLTFTNWVCDSGNLYIQATGDPFYLKGFMPHIETIGVKSIDLLS